MEKNYQLECIRCGKTPENGFVFDGCLFCREEGYNVNFQVDFGDNIPKKEKWPNKGNGLWKYIEFLPVCPEYPWVSLGEGNTPIFQLERLGSSMGFERLYVKDESQNPTWSFKDRLCSASVTSACQQGYQVITASSSGNHGAATAAYAARAGLPCVIFTIPQAAPAMKKLMQAYGAMVVATPSSPGRWEIMEKCVKELNWFPTSGYVWPLIGSNPYGIEGYKTIAFEIMDQMKEVPDFIALPVAYGDGLFGIWKGLKEYNKIWDNSKIPGLIAGEVFGTYQKSLENGLDKPVQVRSGSTVSLSIGTSIGTYQGLKALRESSSLVETSSDQETLEMQKRLSCLEGLYLETSSLVPLVALEKLRGKGKLKGDELIVVILTSTGLKDPEIEGIDIPIIEPKLDELEKILDNNYGFRGREYFEGK